MKFSKWIFIIIIILIITGCGPSYYKKYSLPKNTEGSNCVQTCTTVRNQCRQVEDLQQRSKQELALANDRNYQVCANGRSKKDIKKYCNIDADNSYFYYPSTPNCEDDFDQCFQICGGTIDRILQN